MDQQGEETKQNRHWRAGGGERREERRREEREEEGEGRRKGK